jgi:hypothetical protein
MLNPNLLWVPKGGLCLSCSLMFTRVHFVLNFLSCCSLRAVIFCCSSWVLLHELLHERIVFKAHCSSGLDGGKLNSLPAILEPAFQVA